ncbi:MAG TPA: DUF2255 family protein [Candidatus Dormibacteraeota bacterium]|nr:DUF2255 family protein [Candidatus Dormibacteraeota bacterium]
MRATSTDLLRRLAESDEIEIETRRDSKSPVHRTTIWIVPTSRGVYIRSVYVKGRWYQEALANRNVTIRVGRRKVAARVQRVSDGSLIRAVNAGIREKYGERWPNDARSFVRLSRRHTTLRLTPQ